jgi:putative membrane protein
VRVGLLVAGLGGAALIVLLAWFGVRSIGAEVLRAGWSIPANAALHLVQLFLSACAWGLVVGEPSLRPLTLFRLRVISDGVNSLLPVAHIGGQVVGVRLMTKMGIPMAIAGAGTTLDLTVEAAMQLIFTFAGIAMLSAVGLNPKWASWAEAGLVVGTLGFWGLVVAQRAGLLRVIEVVALRLNRIWPSPSVVSVQGIHRELMRLQENRWTLVRASGLHLLSWSLGTGEVYLALLAIGTPVGLAQAFIIESLGMAARSSAFAVPGALGIQEGGFILVGSLFGVPPDAAIALSMVKRLREVVVGVPALIIWQWSEISGKLSSRGSHSRSQ